MERAAAKAAHMSAPDHALHQSRRFLLLRKGRPHMSQTLAEAAGWAGSAPILHFINLRETEAEREQLVLLAHRPAAAKAEALTQPQHRFKPLDRTPRRVEGLEAANPRHGPLHPEVVALNPLLQMLGDVVHRGARQKALFSG